MNRLLWEAEVTWNQLPQLLVRHVSLLSMTLVLSPYERAPRPGEIITEPVPQGEELGSQEARCSEVAVMTGKVCRLAAWGVGTSTASQVEVDSWVEAS